MADTYTTVQNDAWDVIAKKVYGDEKHADFLMQNNFEYIDIFIFSAGTVLKTPELVESTDSTLPPWRQ